MKIGDKLPNFHFTATNNISAYLADFQGKWLILYFYPKDATPGCTTEGQNFRDNHVHFKTLNAVIFGISRDSLTSHENFKAKQALPFELISDSEEQLSTLFDVIKMKNNFGKQVRGIERSTFIIDSQGVLVYEARKIKVPNHVDNILKALKELQQK